MSSLAFARAEAQKSSSSHPLRPSTPYPLSPNLTREDTASLRPESRSSCGLGLVGFLNQAPFLAPRYWLRLACSPHQADVRRIEPYLVDENGSSVVLRFTQDTVKHIYSLPISYRSSSSSKLSMAPPRTPVRQQGPINGDGISPANENASCITPDTPAPPPKDTPRPKMISSVDKELPPKPTLRSDSSPERRGLLDATDSASKKMTVEYPPLQPSNIGHRPSLSDTSFEVTPSLRSARGSANFEIGTASTKTSLKVQGLPVTITSQRTLCQTASGFSLAPSRIPGSVSTSTRRVAALSHGGHIGAYTNGSPIPRHPSSAKTFTKTNNKFDRGKTRDFQVLPDSSPDDGFRVRVKADAKQLEEILKPSEDDLNATEDTFVNDAVLEFPLQSDGDRRFNKLGVGPTVRYSKDAREVLMGKSSNVDVSLKNASNFGTSASVKMLDDSPYPRIPIPKKAIIEIKSKFQVKDLPASRLARPTASSAARTRDASAKFGARKSSLPLEVKRGTERKKSPEVKKVSKGIRSRVSDLLHGRRRNVQPVAIKTPSPSNRKKFSGPVKPVAMKSPVPSARKMSSLPARKAVTTSTDESLDRSASDIDQRQVRNHSRTTAQVHTTTAAVRARDRASNSSLNDPNDDDDRPPPPPATNSIENLHAHYLEDSNNLQTEDARLSASIAASQTTLNEILAIAQVQGAQYPSFANIVRPIIASLSSGIICAQNARVAALTLRNANQRIMNETMIISEAINVSAAQARTLIRQVNAMLPGATAA